MRSAIRIHLRKVIGLLFLIPHFSFSQVNCNEIPEGFTGLCFHYYESGAIEGKIEVVNGVPTRRGTTYYEDGSLASELNMVESFTQDYKASYIVYNPYGDVQFKIELLNGNGSCFMSNVENSTTISGYYTDNIASDTWSMLDMNGNVINSINAIDLEPKEFTTFEELMTETANMLMQVMDLATTPVHEEAGDDPFAMENDLRAKVKEAYASPALSKDETNALGVIEFPEKEAEFPAGEHGLQQFINKNVKYPEYALENEISGRVYVGFIVEADGTVSNIRVLKRAHESLDIEALRVCFLMPKWIPAVSNGKNVASLCSLPVVFNITD